MCGINGIIGTESGLEQTIEAMNDVLRNRGPDGDGTFVDKGVALGHRRLAIVDAANDAANQPMISGRYVITFNGEIYNHKVLREELEYHGVSFRTECDTEVLLEGYRIFGEDILKKLNGQFAFAIYDKDSGSTFLARDRTAMKPLYFSLENG